MAALRCPAADADVTALSGGEARRVALCRLLLSQPDALLLDEPTNHLDAWSVAWIEDYLARYKGTVLAITHDRYFLDNIADWILEIDSGCVAAGVQSIVLVPSKTGQLTYNNCVCVWLPACLPVLQASYSP